MFNPEKTLVLIRCYPNQMMMPHIMRWTRRNGIPDLNLCWYSKRFITAATNTAIRDKVLPSTAERVIFVDADMQPDHRSDAMLQGATDIVGCTFPVPDMAIWSNTETVHAGLMMSRVEVFRKVRPPWFRNVFTSDGCDVKLCPCQWFSRRAVKAGFTASRAGWADHDATGDAARRGD